MVLPFRFLVSSLHLHGLERFGEVVTLCEVFGPLTDVGLQESSLLLVFHDSLEGGREGGREGGKEGRREGGRERKREGRENMYMYVFTAIWYYCCRLSIVLYM